MKHLFVPYHIAVLAKEKGFNEPCFATYNKLSDGKIDLLPKKYGVNKMETLTSAPLFQQLIDWFREEHKLNIWVIENPYTQGNGNGMYEWNIKPRTIKNQPLPHPKGFGSGCGTEYYQALTKAIEEAFKFIKQAEQKY